MVLQVSPLVTRILGQNPGPYTLQGTNTYLIGVKGSPAILLDAGEDRPEYIPLLRKALDGYIGVSDILLSHYHHDHTLGLKSVLPLLEELKMGKPKIHKFSCKTEASLDTDTLDILKHLQGSFEPSPSGLTHELHDEQTFSVAEGATLKVIATPGHTEDSASFLLQAKDGTVLFTADTVLGQGTAVFTDLKALISSLEKSIAAVEKAAGGTQEKVKLFCGHGPVVEDGVAKMKEYIAHRLQREKQVLEALGKAAQPITAKEYVWIANNYTNADSSSSAGSSRLYTVQTCRRSCCWQPSMASCCISKSWSKKAK